MIKGHSLERRKLLRWLGAAALALPAALAPCAGLGEPAACSSTWGYIEQAAGLAPTELSGRHRPVPGSSHYGSDAAEPGMNCVDCYPLRSSSIHLDSPHGLFCRTAIFSDMAPKFRPAF